MQQSDTPPRIETAATVEGLDVRARKLEGEPVLGFRAFLDGIQRSSLRAHLDGVPVVHGAVAAAIRERVDRRPRSWGAPQRSHALYLPFALIAPEPLRALSARCAVVDSLPEESVESAPRHPGDLAARALTAVQRRREAAETHLAEQWAAEGSGPLLMDGGIAGSATLAQSDRVVGAVKSHRTLYVAGESLALILNLREGERSTAIVLSSPRRTAVATWYLRLREPGPRGPLFGLLRVEIALGDAASITERADLVSRWLLAERRPVSLPDSRWDVMVYGIRECEQYLSAILQ